jgi:hypothetical protein
LLDDAVDAFLDSVSERALDEPLLAMLRAEGFTHVHLTHGSQEFGKDAVARRNGEQWVFQSKAGSIGQPQWRALLGQLEELRLSDYAGPEFDPDLKRRPVLVTTGRMVGNAPLLAAEYNRRAKTRGEPELEIWARDRLVSGLSSNPDAVLRGSIDGALLTTLGAIDRNDISMDDIEIFARRWDSFPAEQLVGLGVVEASLVAERLARSNRLDLACHLGLCFVRAAWANDRSEDTSVLAADAGGSLFETFARQLWSECDDRQLKRRAMIGFAISVSEGFSAWATYSVRCIRLMELLGLLGLRVVEREPELADEIAAYLARFVTAQPGTTHPIGDRFAVSLVPAAVLLGPRKPAAAKRLLAKTTVWLCDRHERDRFGLSATNFTPRAEIDRVFGDMFEHVHVKKRRVSQLAAVLLDVAALLRYRKLYGDIWNDLEAVRLSTMVLRCRDDADQYSLTAAGNRWEMNPNYPEQLPRREGLAVGHHRETRDDRQLVRLGRPWDLLATSSALRDRHFVGALREFL